MQFTVERVKSAGHWLAPLLVFALAAFVYSLYGLDGNLGRDPAIFLYAGQRMADGVPPYVSIFDHKAPLAYILPGLGVIISRLWGGDDIYTVRLLFFTMSCLTAVAVFLLGSSIFERHWVGFFAALTFLGFEPFAQGAGSGPNPKTPVVLFVTLNLLFTSQRKWFWAGLFGSLSLLVWQPTAIFPLITLVLAILRPRPERKAGITKTLLGIVSPVLIILAYFQYHGALYEMFEGSVLFNLFFLDRGITLIASFSRAVDVVFTTYRTMLIPILIGFLQLGYIYKMRRSQYPSSQAMLAGDAFASLFLSFPAPLIWSVFDFQRNPDFFIFLPYAALGFGHFLDLAVLGLYRQKGGGFLSVGLALSLLLLAGAQGANKRESGLETQRQSALEIERRFGPDIRVASIGAPQVMVLLHRVNPNRYLFIYNGVDRLIAANTQGGFEGWIRELETYSPDLVAFGPTRGFYIPLLLEWLEENYHQVEIGPWLFWVRNSDAT